MKRQHLQLGAAAAALIAVGAYIAGVPLNTILLVALVLACPVMMLFMHGGGGHSGHGGGTHDHQPGSDNVHWQEPPRP